MRLRILTGRCLSTTIRDGRLCGFSFHDCLGEPKFGLLQPLLVIAVDTFESKLKFLHWFNFNFRRKNFEY